MNLMGDNKYFDVTLDLLKQYNDYQLEFQAFVKIIDDLIHLVKPNCRFKRQLNADFNIVYDEIIGLSPNEEFNNRIVFGGLKGFPRLLTKVITEYNGDIQRCSDIFRVTFDCGKLGIKVDDFPNLISQITFFNYTSKFLYRLAVCKEFKNTYYLTQWVSLLDDKKIGSLIGDKFNIQSSPESPNLTDLIRTPTSPKIIPDVKLPDVERNSVELYVRYLKKTIKISSSEFEDIKRYRFEVQFDFPNSIPRRIGEDIDDHFEYEWDRLQSLSNLDQLKVQKVELQMMLRKSAIKRALRKNYFERINRLLKCSSCDEYNYILSVYKKWITDIDSTLKLKFTNTRKSSEESVVFFTVKKKDSITIEPARK